MDINYLPHPHSATHSRRPRAPSPLLNANESPFFCRESAECGRAPEVGERSAHDLDPRWKCGGHGRARNG